MRVGRSFGTVQLEKVALIDYGVSGLGAMVRSIGGLKTRSTDCHTISFWISSALFAVLLSWVGLIGVGGAMTRLALHV